MASGKAVVLGSDDVGAVVVDCGSWAVRFGNAGDDAPRAIVPSAAGTRRTGDGLLAGDRLTQAPHATSDIRPVHVIDAATGGAVVRDWEAMQAVWAAAYGQLRVDAAAAPLLIVEPSRGWGDDARARALEAAFEGVGVPAAYLGRGSAMAAFAAARTTACVVDVGHQGACAVPVTEGYALKKATRTSPVGGHFLSARLAEWLDARLAKQAAGGDAVMQDAPPPGAAAAAAPPPPAAKPPAAAPPVARLRALHEVRGGAPPAAAAAAAPPSDAHQAFFRLRAVDEAKANVMRVTPRGADAAADAAAEGGDTTYALPDGQVVDLCEEDGLDIANVLFKNEDGTKIRALPNLVYDAVSACDTDCRRELYGGVVLTGGSSVIPGILERFTTDLSVLTPQPYKLKVIGTQSMMERASGPWIGGSIVASLGTFQTAWVSKKEYDELGAHGSLRKCP